MFNIFKKAPARIKVRIERGDQPYFPEEIVQSVITIQAEKTFLVDKLSAALIVEETFVTEDSDGDKTTNVAYKDVVDEQILIHDSEIPEGRQRGFTVSFRIPENAVPFHYDARLQCVWKVEANLKPKKGRSKKEYGLVNVVVPPPNVATTPVFYGKSNSPENVELSLWLPSLEWVEGDTIEGRIVIKPRKPFDIKEIRADLERRQVVHAKMSHISITTIPASEVAIGKIKLQPDREYDIPFDVTVPKLKTPTRNTSTSTVTWKIKGVLSRSWRTDFNVEQEIFVYGARKKP
jgi:hypothetical protein